MAIRHGFESDNLIGRVLNHLAGIGQKIKEKYNYIVNYEAYARQKMTKVQTESKQQIRVVARKVANYLDEQSHYLTLRRKITKQAEELKVGASNLKEFKALYSQSVLRDKNAHEVWTKHSNQWPDVQILNAHKTDIHRASERYERHLLIAEFAEYKSSMPLPERLIQRSRIIDLEQDKTHVMQLASQFNKKSSELFQQIKSAQKFCRQSVLNQLKKDYPLLVEFDKLFNERSPMIGFKAEQLDKLLLAKAHEITKDKCLYAQLQRDLPNFAHSIFMKIKNQCLDIDREH